VIAGATTAGAAESGIKAIKVAAGGDAWAPGHKRDPEVLQLAGPIVRPAAPATVVGGQDDQSVAPYVRSVGDGVENPSDKPVSACDSVEVLRAHETGGVASTIR